MSGLLGGGAFRAASLLTPAARMSTRQTIMPLMRNSLLLMPTASRQLSTTKMVMAAKEPRRLKRDRRWRLLRRRKDDPNEASQKQSTQKNSSARDPYPEQQPHEDEDGSHRSEKDKSEQDKDKKSQKNDPNIIFATKINLNHVLWFFFGAIFLASLLGGSDFVPEITYHDFKTQYLDKGQVSRIQVINAHYVRVYTRSNPEVPAAVFTIGSVDALERHLKEAQDALGIETKDRIPVLYNEEGSLLGGIFGLLPTLMFLVFLVWITRRTSQRSGGGMGGVFGIGKSKAHKYDPTTDVRVRFQDVAGMDEAKVEVMEFVEFLKKPEKYTRLGAKIPRGAILSGPPGTGKTLLAKATAGEADVPFFSVSGSEFVEMFSGVGASRVRDLFKRAKEKTPSMIWIDEIDAIGKARAGAGFRGGNDERESTLNQLLVEMDGFSSDEHVVILAGTNRADMLDKALLRPGRFDRNIQIDLPTLEGRREIYDVHLKSIVHDKNIAELSGKLSAMTPGFSGADIANCCNEAALAAARVNAKHVEMVHFEQAIDRVIAGLERRSRVLPVAKRKIVAYHEAGHAVAGWFLRYADPLVKVTIVPHGAAALGYAQLLPGDINVTTSSRLDHLITVALGGRVSEEIFFDTVTVGASDDFKRITGIARAMVCDFGFSPIGTVRLERPQGAVSKSYSAATDSVVDQQIKQIIDQAHEQCKNLLTEKKELVELVAEELLAKEQLTRADLVRLLGPRPFRDSEHEAFKKYLDVQ